MDGDKMAEPPAIELSRDTTPDDKTPIQKENKSSQSRADVPHGRENGHQDLRQRRSMGAWTRFRTERAEAP